MSTSPGLAFANLTLLLDVPQLPAIWAVNAWRELNGLFTEMKTLAGTSDLLYPSNRYNPQNEKTNRMGRPRKYNHGECESMFPRNTTNLDKSG
ncbi:hypothetical protein TGDOM2_310180 [Toxoplasma gondii GAB2-2007-GAL-DOM2]|uniref:Transmembrane protein n=5 Tax=Toxoplasma gondii TaxID=5811 RepID=A0A086LGK9_TOXGO|nr:hypothetical protein TGP89_310180 [Toxoplasma gondii p89]KFG44582.1 hypothetical protein TGDOM2_310180 [Toxoplasma gondii GAB2-2007-GAL-DOM2]KFG55777.1 hypothetical protein TGFOU_310180 [Toxoplasma gondii FOU]PUA91944.1 hypothetical protein TGBR9_310180 [Toxoplasma gondii TgCATBr9]RQX72389.1 hypothetical protein TGCAST_310180 [Toxoplasma gondii CAST]